MNENRGLGSEVKLDNRVTSQYSFHFEIDDKARMLYYGSKARMKNYTDARQDARQDERRR